MSAHMIEPRSAACPILKVENLAVQRGHYLAVYDVSFELLPGTSTAIVGPNGSGKSTLVQAMLDLLPRVSGNVEIFGSPIARLGHQRQRIGYMPQHFIFDRSFPICVQELVELGWTPAGRQIAGSRKIAGSSQSAGSRQPGWRNLGRRPEQAAAVERALRRVNGWHLRRQAIGTLSGGELKRVLLAYCLVVPRQFLVLDEAFAGVDAQGEAAFYDLLEELRSQEGWTVLQISHDLEMVSRYCDQILCLNRTLVCSGRPELALSPENLLSTYGPAFSRYQHHH